MTTYPPTTPPGRTRWRRLSVPFLVLTLIASTAVVLGPTAPAYASEYYNDIESASDANRNWMSRVPDDASLAELSIPGTHDTLALCGHSAGGNGEDCEFISTSVTQTQEPHGYSAETLAVQLEAGIRSIDIRVRVNKDSAGLRFTVHHGVYYQYANFTDVLTKIETFLDANPDETILLHLKAECTAESGSCSDADGYGSTLWRRNVFDSYRTGDYYTGDGYETSQGKSWEHLLWTESVNGSTQATVPPLGDVRGKIVMLGFHGPHGGVYPGYGIGQLYPVDESTNYIQDDYSVPTISDIDDKWEKVRTHLRKTNGVWDANRGEQNSHPHEPDSLYMNNTSGTGDTSANPGPAAPPLIKDGNWQTGDQGGRWTVQPGHTGPNAGTGLSGTFHRVSLALDYCQIIPAGKSLDVPIIYYIPATGPVNTTVKLGATTYASVPEHNRGAAKVTPVAGGCSAPAWAAGTIYNPATQPVENVTVKYDGKVWQAKWWTQGNVPGTGADPDHEPWRLIGPAS